MFDDQEYRDELLKILDEQCAEAKRRLTEDNVFPSSIMYHGERVCVTMEFHKVFTQFGRQPGGQGVPDEKKIRQETCCD